MTAVGRGGTEPPPLPGDCIPIPQVRGQVRDAGLEGTRVIETHVVPGLDLDGHGSRVVLVPPDRQDLNLHSVWWRLFIQRGDCGHDLGIVVGLDDPVAESGESHGLRNFSVAEPDGSDGLQGVAVTTYEFDGQRYLGGRREQH